MQALAIDGAWLFAPRLHQDERGSFLGWFRDSEFQEALGYRLDVAQANCSVSRRGVIRGIHFSDVPPGQAKYVTCVSGSIMDVVVDLRVGSPGFGTWQAVTLDAEDHHAVFLAEGLGHGFAALSEEATVLYLCSTGYNAAHEHGVHPLDPELGIEWPGEPGPVLSRKDSTAPSLAEAAATGLLPRYDGCITHTAALRSA